MPITLITGLPGHGKTLYTLARYREEVSKAPRDVFQCAGEPDASVRQAGTLKPITGLKLPWPVIDPMRWHEASPGSLVIIDEAQFVFPTRGRGEPPDWVARLATHRHLGIDIVLITQDPMLLDSFVRRLVDRHFHVVRKFGSHWATIHEFANGVKDQVSKSRNGSIRHEWRYPKDVFDLYTSAEVHTVKRRVPMRVWLLLAVPFVGAALAWAAYARLNPAAQQKRANEETARMVGPSGSSSGPGRGGARAEPLTVAQFASAYVPRIDGLPHTAPVYDEVTKPIEAPVPAACIQSKDRCSCYSQQATKLEVAVDLCKSIVAGGFFVNWRQGGKADVRQAIPLQAKADEKPAVPYSGAFYPGPGGYGMAARGGSTVAAADPEAPPGRGRAPAVRR